MEKKLKKMFWPIEIHTVLWMVVVGLILSGSVESTIKVFVGAGFIVAAVLQHWAYYGIYNEHKELAKAD